MNRQTIVVKIAALVAMLVACKGVEGSGKSRSEVRTPGDFDSVRVSGVFELELTVGPACSVELDGDDNLLALVESRIEGTSLVLRTKKPVHPRQPLKARVTAPDIRKVSGSGASKLHVTGVDNAELALDLGGSGSIVVEGATKKVSIAISGAGSADTTRLAAARVEIDVSGAGEIQVGAPEELDVAISGAGNVSYAGDPRITQRISGAGRLVKR